MLWTVYELSVRYRSLAARRERALAYATRVRSELLTLIGEADVGSREASQYDVDYQAMEECVDALAVGAWRGSAHCKLGCAA